MLNFLKKWFGKWSEPAANQPLVERKAAHTRVIADTAAPVPALSRLTLLSPNPTIPHVDEIPSQLFSKPLDPEALRVAEAQVAAEWKVGDVILDLYEVRKISGDKDYAEGGMGRV